MTLLGERGTMTVASKGPEGPGEAEFQTAGGTRCVIAHSSEPLSRGTEVAVYNERSSSHVDVAAIN